MKPLFYSSKLASQGKGWYRDGSNIEYYPNNNDENTLQFEVSFSKDDDEVYVAYAYPYTYSDLMAFLEA